VRRYGWRHGLVDTSGEAVPGKPKVENLDSVVPGQEDVLGLEIAMNDALVVRGGETGSDLQRVLDGFSRRNRAVGEVLAKRLTATAFASRWKRAKSSESRPGRTLTATSRSSRASRAR
jgi:hypothetical protein